jgi:hypothetical protein
LKFVVIFQKVLFEKLYFLGYLSVYQIAALPLFTTCLGLGAGEAFTAARTGAKLSNLHKLSGEPLPRLRQTAR